MLVQVEQHPCPKKIFWGHSRSVKQAHGMDYGVTMRGRNAQKVVWNNPTGKNAQPSLPQTNRGLPSIVSFFDHVPEGCTRDSYEKAMIPGAMFTVAKGAYLITGVWEGTGSDQLSYLSLWRHNPVRSLSVSNRKLESPRLAIYVGQQRVTEWDGKGWSRVMRSMFIIDGNIYAALTSGAIRPA